MDISEGLYQVSIDAASNKDLNKLLEAYPIDNDPCFHGKRVFHNETGYFDLTDMKLHVWAVAKVALKLMLV